MSKIKLVLLPNETVAHIARPSELTLIGPALIMLLAIYLPWYFLIRYGLSENYYLYMVVWTGAVFAYGLSKLLLWRRSRYIITSRRLIVVQPRGLAGERRQELDLRYVQNITLETAGILGSVGRVSNVLVQGANPADKLILKAVDRAGDVKNLLWQQRSPN